METDKLDPKTNLRQLAKLFPVARRYNAQRKEHHALRTWWNMRNLPVQHNYLYLYTCPNCSPTLIFFRHLQINKSRKVAIPSKFNQHCTLCNAIRCCYLHFADQYPPMDFCLVQYLLPSYVLLEFRYMPEDTDSSLPRITIQLYSSGRPNPLFPFKNCADVIPDPRSLDMVTKVQSWIKECIKNHQGCALEQGNQSPKFQGSHPSRLIRLDGDQDDVIRLASPSMPVQFAALSYCWGNTEQNVTLTSNLSSRHQRLSVTSLPQTHQDAIFFTRALGLKYLWIDSICIVQDESKDWATEAGKMGDIYATAWVVLAAASAPDSSRGFLDRRKDIVTMRPLQLGPDLPSIHARQINHHWSTSIIELQGYPLFKRAWCLQERELARRIVHFTPDEVYMVCQSGHICECGMVSGKFVFEFGLTPFRKAMQAKEEDSTNWGKFGALWAKILSDYTALKLSHATDALPALSGLAQRMSHFKPGAYIAGLWEKDIACSLDWQISRGENREALPEPTFSWTASSYPVSFGIIYTNEVEATLCHYVSHECIYTTGNVYGHVSAASLCLRGQAVSGLDLFNATPQCFNDPLSKFDNHALLDNGQMLGASHLSADGNLLDKSAPTSPDRTSVICFALYSYTKYSSERICATLLVLQLKADSVGQYVRIGLARDIKKVWFDEHASPITVTIT